MCACMDVDLPGEVTRVERTEQATGNSAPSAGRLGQQRQKNNSREKGKIIVSPAKHCKQKHGKTLVFLGKTMERQGFPR